MTIVIALPEPPSVNQLYTTNHRRSKKYRSWLKEAGWSMLIKRANKPRIAGFYTILLVIYERSRRDADNTMKAVLDLMVSHQVTDDDRYCKRATAEKTGQQIGQCAVHISPWIPAQPPEEEA